MSTLAVSPSVGHTPVAALDVAAVLLDDDPSPVLVDCLGVWITRILDEVGAWNDEALSW